MTSGDKRRGSMIAVEHSSASLIHGSSVVESVFQKGNCRIKKNNSEELQVKLRCITSKK